MSLYAARRITAEFLIIVAPIAISLSAKLRRTAASGIKPNLLGLVCVGGGPVSSLLVQKVMTLL